MRKELLKIGSISSIIFGKPSNYVYLYVHGQGGCKEDAHDFASIVTNLGWQVLSIDLPKHGERADESISFEPWNVVPELTMVMNYIKSNWCEISLCANSIGAWFCMLSFAKEKFCNCLFISPVLDMHKLILNMMTLSNVYEEQLEQEKIIPTTLGNDLSWEYLMYVRTHPIINWSTPTKILYGDKDHLVERIVVDTFSKHFNCELTVVNDCEHWFHTDEQLKILRKWFEDNLSFI